MSIFNNIGIIGAGNYGIAIAQCFSNRAQKILLVSNIEICLDMLNQQYANITSSPERTLNANIDCTNDFSWIKGCDLIFIATPASAVADVCEKILKYEVRAPVVLCSKGFDVGNGRLLSSVIEEILDNQFLVFSGPSFAGEIARGLPAGVNVAGRNRELSRDVAASLSSNSFKINPIDDFISLQVAGAMKNALAVGCGILAGLELGESAIAQLIVNGFQEMIELASALGGQKESFFELGGLGDTVLTCTSQQSRNVAFGKYLATGGNLNDYSGCLAEGAFTIKTIPILEKNHVLKLRLFHELYEIVYENKNILEFRCW